MAGIELTHLSHAPVTVLRRISTRVLCAVRRTHIEAVVLRLRYEAEHLKCRPSPISLRAFWVARQWDTPVLAAQIACVLLLFFATSVQGLAAEFYVRQGASGDGSTWTAAYGSLPSTLVRGATYYIADGTYGSYTFSAPISGTQPIIIRKAIDDTRCAQLGMQTAECHGVSTGWSDTYGDGQAIFTGGGTVLQFNTAYWIFDGVTGSNNSGHGFVVRMTSTTANSVFGIHLNSAAASNVTVAHTEVHHSNVCSAVSANVRQDAIRTTGADNATIHHVYLHDLPTNLIIATNSDNWLVEHSWLQASHSTSTNHGQAIYHGYTASNGWTIRHNIFKDINGSAVVFFSTRIAGTAIYGNVFWEQATTTCGGVYSVGSLLGANPGTSTTGVTGLRFYNNTIVNLDGRGVGSSNISIDLGSDNLAYNNLWYGTTPSCVGTTCSHNDTNISDPTLFFDYAGGNFRLKRATAAGLPLAAPHNTDPDNIIRGGDGVWDRGAYEFQPTSTTNPPPSITVTVR